MRNASCYLCFPSMCVIDSIEAEVLAILEAMHIFSSSVQGSLIIKSDSSILLLGWSLQIVVLGNFLYNFQEIKVHSSSLEVFFQHVGRSAIAFADVLVSKGWRGLIPLWLWLGNVFFVAFWYNALVPALFVRLLACCAFPMLPFNLIQFAWYQSNQK